MSSASPRDIPSVPGLLGLTNAPPRSESARVLLDLLGRRGALLGIAWVAFMVFCAVFAPFIANSRPILLKLKDGGWSSPMIATLNWVDVTLLVVTLVGVALLIVRKVDVLRSIVILGAVGLIVGALSWCLIPVPKLVRYDEFRQLERDGKIEHAIYTIIPFSPLDRLSDVFFPDFPNPQPPRATELKHLMGTDIYGASVASRMVHAFRIALGVGFVSTGIAVVLGIAVGGLMGYFSGAVDLLGMRFMEMFSSIPTFFLILAMIAAWGQGEWTLYVIMVIIGVTGFPGYAIFIRAEFLKLRKQDFVQAAVAAGIPLRSILFRHLLPNGVTPVLVSASFGVAGAMSVENSLSFLGVGLVEEPSFGGTLGQTTGAGASSFYAWLAIFPGLALTFSIFAFVLIGEALRDVIDPYTNRKS